MAFSFVTKIRRFYLIYKRGGKISDILPPAWGKISDNLPHAGGELSKILNCLSNIRLKRLFMSHIDECRFLKVNIVWCNCSELHIPRLHIKVFRLLFIF